MGPVERTQARGTATERYGTACGAQNSRNHGALSPFPACKFQLILAQPGLLQLQSLAAPSPLRRRAQCARAFPLLQHSLTTNSWHSQCSCALLHPASSCPPSSLPFVERRADAPQCTRAARLASAPIAAPTLAWDELMSIICSIARRSWRSLAGDGCFRADPVRYG